VFLRTDRHYNHKVWQRHSANPRMHFGDASLQSVCYENIETECSLLLKAMWSNNYDTV